MRNAVRASAVGLLGTGLLALLAWSLAPSVSAGGASLDNPRVYPPDVRVLGLTYGEWGAEWQQWVFTTTTAKCPVTDTTGKYADLHQWWGKMYFLAGTFGQLPETPWAAPNPVTRDVTVPSDVSLCIPINNWGLIYPEDLDGPLGILGYDPGLFAGLSAMYDALDAAYDSTPADTLLCEVDGATVQDILSYRSQSEPIPVYVPANNVQNDLMAYFAGMPGYRYYAEGWHWSVSDGYYVILKPLAPGKHTIHLRSGDPEAPFCDVHYNLTVKRVR
jgi:hypothetical protein